MDTHTMPAFPMIDNRRCARYDQLEGGRGVGRCATHTSPWTTDAWRCDAVLVVDPTGGRGDNPWLDQQPDIDIPVLSPMARRVSANKAAQLRTGGERPMGSDGSR